MRGFTKTKDDVRLPIRVTRCSAGYDFFAPRDILLAPKQTAFVNTGIRVHMMHDEVLMIYPRSSLATVHNIVLRNGVAVIDADYDQEIFLVLLNDGDETYIIRHGDRFAQGVFQKYLITDDDSPVLKRIGGLGSTG